MPESDSGQSSDDEQLYQKVVAHKRRRQFADDEAGPSSEGFASPDSWVEHDRVTNNQDRYRQMAYDRPPLSPMSDKIGTHNGEMVPCLLPLGQVMCQKKIGGRFRLVSS